MKTLILGIFTLCLLSMTNARAEICAVPNPDASTLFKMIADNSSSARAIDDFLNNHVVGWDSVNQACETTVVAALNKNREDVFEVLYSHYHPNVSLVQPHSSDSIYSQVLKTGSRDLIQFILSNAPSPSLQPVYAVGLSEGTTPLMIAARYNTLDVVIYLVQSGSKVNEQDNAGNSVLMEALNNKDSFNIVSFLIHSKANINGVNSAGMTPILIAAQQSQLPVVQLLLDAKANYNVVDHMDRTTLFYAAGNRSAGVAQKFISLLPTAVNTPDSNGVTPLSFAAPAGSAAAIRSLINSGASVNVADNDKMTPLMKAAGSNSAEVVQTLVSAGADVDAHLSQENTALVYAVLAGLVPNQKILINSHAQADLSYCYISNSNAYYNNSVEICQPVLDMSVERLSVESVKLLADAKANPNASDSRNATPLMVAAQQDFSQPTVVATVQEIIEVLLQHGADTKMRDGKKRTAYDIARYNKAPDSILNLLK